MNNHIQREKYFKVKPKNLDNYWICSAKELKQDIVSWLDEADGKITITAIKMTKAEFNELPEFEG